MKANKLKLNRRETMLSLLAVASAGMAAGCKDKTATQPSGESKFKIGDPFLNASEMALLTTAAGLIIPKTDTPGADEAGVQDTIQDLLSNWTDGDVRSYWREGIKSISKHFDMAAEDKAASLSALDSGVYSKKIDLPFYHDFKQAIVGAYYMSEAGATEELAYDPVPGDFKGCIDFSEVGKAWAT